ncbi:MAG: cytochrome c [Gammaproteobacteria bacterium]|nr:cytochrome c [Gammaproteobacteria bacterium]
MKKIAFIVAATFMAVSGATLAGGDAAAGKSKSAVCAGCHGSAGISIGPLFPNLAGQKEGYLVKQLKAFKSGTRKDPIMGNMAKPLSDSDMANLAAHFSGLPAGK